MSGWLIDSMIFRYQTSSTSAISGQPQNDTVDEAEQTRRRREVKENEDEEKSSSKVKREAEPAKDKTSTETGKIITCFCGGGGGVCTHEESPFFSNQAYNKNLTL